MTFQALYDVVKAQSVAIREQERRIQNKAEVPDIQRSFDEMAGNLRTRATIKAVNNSMDRIMEMTESRCREMHEYCETSLKRLETKVDYCSQTLQTVSEDVRKMQLQICTKDDMKEYIDMSLKKHFELSYASKTELHALADRINAKADRGEIDVLLNEQPKQTGQMVNNLWDRWASRDVELAKGIDAVNSIVGEQGTKLLDLEQRCERVVEENFRVLSETRILAKIRVMILIL